MRFETLRARRRARWLATVLVAVLAAATAVATPAPARGASPSLEGYTGLLRTPSAWVEESGRMLFLVGQPGDTGTWQGATRYALTLGFLRYLEVAGMDTAPPQPGSALSANFKLQAPLDLLLPGVPVGLAAGAEDIGGAYAQFKTWYLVASAHVWRLDGSIGWGTGPDRMKGLFGGLSLSPVDGVELVADWDTLDLNVGAKASVSLAALIGVPIRIGGILTSAVTRSPASLGWGATLEIPLWWNETGQGTRTSPPFTPEPAAPPAPSSTPPAAPPPAPAPVLPDPALARLEAALVEEGFEEVRVGRLGDRVVLEYENDRYNYDQSDGLYVVMQEVARSEVAQAPITVVLKRHGLRLAEVEFAGDRPAGGRFLPTATAFTPTPPERPAAWVSASPQNPVLLHSQVVIAPGLRTWVGTESGVFNFALSLRPELIVPFWPGFVGYVQADIPFYWTPALADGGGLAAYRPTPKLQYALLQQALGLGHGVMAMAGGGILGSSKAGGFGQVVWAPGNGDLALGLQGAALWDLDQQRFLSATASIRYRVPSVDLVASLQAGRFVNGDMGASLEISRWFGDTQVGFFATASDYGVVGAFITIPLTLRRDMRPGYVQVRGSRRWEYALGTRVGSDWNPVGWAIGVSPVSPVNLETEYLDESRISLDGLVREFDVTAPLPPSPPPADAPGRSSTPSR